jgi:putative aldouronate transport system permease protein
MRENQNRLGKRIVQHKYFYLLSALAILYFILFRYVPMWGLSIAFQKFSPVKGFRGSEWVGFKNFVNFFTNPFFFNILRNTFVISILKLILFFPLPIILSLMFNEIKHKKFKSINQTIVYFPYFISWVVTASLTFFLLSSSIGIVNKIFYMNGLPAISFLVEPKYFWLIIVGQTIWKETGYGTILFLSAISAIDQGQYQAAKIDGASRMQRIWYVTLPGMRPTIVTVLILRLGQVLDVGFEQILLMYNPAVRDVAEIFDTYAYWQGIAQGQFSLGATVGLFKGAVGVVFLLAANKLAKRLGSEGLF